MTIPDDRRRSEFSRACGTAVTDRTLVDPRHRALQRVYCAVMTSEVRPQISSIILKRLFTEGSEVKEDQSLYEIDPCPSEAQLAQAEADKAKNEASLANAKLNLARDGKPNGRHRAAVAGRVALGLLISLILECVTVQG